VPDLERLDFFLEEPPEELTRVPAYWESRDFVEEERVYDLFITCDVSSRDRIGVAGELFDRARRTLCVDHHVSNPLFADQNIVEPKASSCSEVLYGLMDPERIDRSIAHCLFTGIISDSGVFQYPNTTPSTHRIAADLIEKGIDFSQIIDDAFNFRTFAQNRLLAYTLNKAKLYCGGLCIAVTLTLKEMETLGVTKKDLDPVVAMMRYTRGTEAAVFLYEKEPGVFKASLRSNTYLDVSEIALSFGGGGHFHAAGCLLEGSAEAALHRLLEVMEERLKTYEQESPLV
jgi:phosphoesterase RecJ-like protein